MTTITCSYLTHSILSAFNRRDVLRIKNQEIKFKFKQLIENTKINLQDGKKRLEVWEAVFFSTEHQKHEFENLFSKNIYDNGNALYMSWIPLKLAAIGKAIDIDTFNSDKNPLHIPKIFQRRCVLSTMLGERCLYRETNQMF